MKFLNSLNFTGFIILICTYVNVCQSANILFFFGISTYSHRITVWPLVEALAEKGHSVTFLQPEENKNPNPKVTEIVPQLDKDSVGELNFLQNRLKYGKYGTQSLVLMLPMLGTQLCEYLLNDKVTLEWINKSKFDLVVIDALYNDCGLGLAYKFKANHIIFGTTTVFSWWIDSLGIPHEGSWLPEIHWPVTQPMSFLSRAFHALTPLYYHFQKRFVMYPALETLFREKLGLTDMPPLHELERNASLILMNSHFSEEVARSLPPLIVPIGGMHCKNTSSPLPKDIQKFIEGSKDGFMYVSFGSGAKISTAPQELQNVFFNAMAKSKLRFLWKWEGNERPANMPSNVLTAKWMPQQDILAHPKIVGFLSHCGLLVFAEQDYNAERIHRTKRGISLEISELKQEDLENAISSLLTDPIYRKNMKNLQKRFKDRPATPLQTALWWTEYVLRNPEDTHYLRPLFPQHQYWFQRRLLDVWLFYLVIICTFIGLSLYLTKKFLTWCFCSSKKSNVRKSDKKVKRN